jgi:hypothetical protein
MAKLRDLELNSESSRSRSRRRVKKKGEDKLVKPAMERLNEVKSGSDKKRKRRVVRPVRPAMDLLREAQEKKKDESP